MKPSKILEKSKLAKGSLARLRNGYPCDWDDYRAAAFCLEGAVRRSLGDKGSSKFRELIDKIGNKLSCSIIDFNDDPKTKKKDVIELLRSVGL